MAAQTKILEKGGGRSTEYGGETSKADMYMTSTVFEETPELGIEDTPFGFHYAALRDAVRTKI